MALPVRGPQLRIRRKMKPSQVKTLQAAAIGRKKEWTAADQEFIRIAFSNTFIRRVSLQSEGIAMNLEEWLAEGWFLFSEKLADLLKKGTKEEVSKYKKRTRKFAKEYLGNREDMLWPDYMRAKTNPVAGAFKSCRSGA